MATHAVGRAQRVVVVDVAGGAGRRVRRHVRARQREPVYSVIKRRAVPAHRRVAVRAIRRCERRAGSRVHRVVGLLPIGQVAAGVPAGVRSDLQIVVVVDVTRGAGHIRMAVCQEEPRDAVIERHVCPSRRIVAGRAERSRKGRSRLGVRRVVGLLPGRQVAARVPAIIWPNLQIVVVVDVARSAGHIGVPVRQQKARGAVIEFRSEPVVKIVAALAFARRKSRPRARVRRIRRLLPFFQVARFASRRQSVEDSRRGSLVALLAGHGRVRAKQREAILVILHLLYGNVPALDRVAQLAIRTHLPAVNIRVAVGAILSHVGEDRLYVALHTRYFFVHAAQRIVRLVVIKLRHRADRAPARRRVTVFARNRQRPVRTPRGFVRMLLRVGNLVCDSRNCRCQKIMVSARQHQQHPENELGDSSRNSSPTPQLGIAVIKTAKFPALLLDRRAVATVRMYRSWPMHKTVKKLRAIYRLQEAISRPRHSMNARITTILSSIVHKRTT